jgi:hypothetical protein
MRSSLALLALSAITSHAATLAFVSNTTITSDSALDAPLVLHPTGTLAQAVNYGSGAQTVNTTGGQTIAFTSGGVTGTATLPAAPSSVTTVYNAGTQPATANLLQPGTTGDTQFDAVLDGGAWHNKTTDATQPMALRIGSLTIGQTYIVSLFSVDQRAGSAGRAQAYWDTFSGGVFSGGTSGSFSQNTPIMTMFTFTADADFQDIFIEETDNAGNADTNLAAFTLYAIPEPSSAALVGGMGLLALLRRRRS